MSWLIASQDFFFRWAAFHKLRISHGHSVMNSLQARFEAFLRKHRLIRRGNTVLLAVSGGVDSMVMLRLFSEIRSLWKLTLGVVHVNHMLRGGESDEDESFVREHADRLSVPFYSTKVDTTVYSKQRREGTQEAARELRYQFFDGVVHQTRANALATAHHTDDNAETVLLNILRGAGVRGLSGIPLKREYFIRPLLFVSRDEIELYAKEHLLRFRNDSSNSLTDYTRNLLRNRIIPRLNEKYGSNVVLSLNRVSSLMREVDMKLEQRLTDLYPGLQRRSGVIELDTTRLALEPDFIQEQAVLRLLRSAGIETTQKKIRSVVNLMQGATGARLNLGKRYTIFRNRQRLVLKKEEGSSLQTHAVTVGRSYSFPTFQFSASAPESIRPSLKNRDKTELVDAEKLGDKLVIRSWRHGDWFVPLGLGHRKKLSDFLVDEKVPLYEKSEIPVLEAHGDIVWVCGRRLDDRFKVTPSTRLVVRLTYRTNTHV